MEWLAFVSRKRCLRLKRQELGGFQCQHQNEHQRKGRIKGMAASGFNLDASNEIWSTNTHMLNIWSIHLPLVVVLVVNLGNYTIKLSIWDIYLIHISPTDCFNLERIWAFLRSTKARKPTASNAAPSAPSAAGDGWDQGCQWMFGDVEIYHAIEGRLGWLGHKRRVVGSVGSVHGVYWVRFEFRP